MDDVQEQVQQAHMNECLARGMAVKETARLKEENKSLREENKSLQEKVEQFEDRNRNEFIQDRQKARRYFEVAKDEAEQLKLEIKSLQDKYEDERKFAEEQVFQFEMDYQLLQNKLNECEIDKETLKEKLKQCHEGNQQLKYQNDKLEYELFEVCELNPKFEASTKGDQSTGNTDAEIGGIPRKEKGFGPRGGCVIENESSIKAPKLSTCVVELHDH
jgi:chromosome segregation ATPase